LHLELVEGLLNGLQALLLLTPLLLPHLHCKHSVRRKLFSKKRIVYAFQGSQREPPKAAARSKLLSRQLGVLTRQRTGKTRSLNLHSKVGRVLGRTSKGEVRRDIWYKCCKIEVCRVEKQM